MNANLVASTQHQGANELDIPKGVDKVSKLFPFRVICKYPKLRVLITSFVKTKDEIKGEAEKSRQEKRRDQNAFSANLVLTGVSPPVLDLLYLLLKFLQIFH
jgi:hypothetical protein